KSSEALVCSIRQSQSRQSLRLQWGWRLLEMPVQFLNCNLATLWELLLMKFLIKWANGVLCMADKWKCRLLCVCRLGLQVEQGQSIPKALRHYSCTVQGFKSSFLQRLTMPKGC